MQLQQQDQLAVLKRAGGRGGAAVRACRFARFHGQQLQLFKIRHAPPPFLAYAPRAMVTPVPVVAMHKPFWSLSDTIYL